MYYIRTRKPTVRFKRAARTQKTEDGRQKSQWQILLFQFGALRSCRLASPILVDDERLVGKERAPATAAERLRHGRDRITSWSALDGEYVTGVLAGRQSGGDQIGGRRARIAASGRRSKFSQRRGVAAELRVIHGLRFVQGLDLAERRSLLSVHPRLIEFGKRNGKDNQDDCDDNEQLDQREAALVQTVFPFRQHG